MSLRVRFVLIIGVLSLLSAVSLAFFSYRFSVNNAMVEARKQGNIVFNYIEASRSFFRDKQLPQIMGLVDKDRFLPELMSGFALTRGVWENFSKNLSGYIFKQATVDPLHPPNKADAQELAIIDEFRNRPELKTKEGILEKGGEKYFYFARPVKVEKGCLRCHGNPDDAPRDQVEIYGTASGYHWLDGDTVASFIVYVPIQAALDNARQSATQLFLIGSGGILLIMLIFWVFLNKYVVGPVTMLEQRATDISLGKDIASKITPSSNDEIGSLARAVDRLRISMEKMLQRYKGK
jgi:HAMP domain-containing protein